MPKMLLLLIMILMLMPETTPAQDGGAISLDHVDGLVEGSIPVSSDTVTFWLRLSDDDPQNSVRAMTNGFEFSGSDPAVSWEIVEWDCLQSFQDNFDLFWDMSPVNVDGTGADTIGYGGSVMGVPLPSTFNQVAYWFLLTFTDPASAGHEFCLDSAWYPPNGPWLWGYGFYVGTFPPSWDGPHCFEIYSCCDGIRGNVDCDPSGQISISDLVYLVDYMFNGGPAPLDMTTADFYDDGTPDIGDLVYLVDYMFNGGAPPPDCP